MALATAGVTAGLDSSPTPPGLVRSPCTISISTAGMSLIRTTRYESKLCCMTRPSRISIRSKSACPRPHIKPPYSCSSTPPGDTAKPAIGHASELLYHDARHPRATRARPPRHNCRTPDWSQCPARCRRGNGLPHPARCAASFQHRRMPRLIHACSPAGTSTGSRLPACAASSMNRLDREHIGDIAHRSIPAGRHARFVPHPAKIHMRRTVRELARADCFGGAVVHTIGAIEITRLPLLRRSRRHRTQLQRSQFAVRVERRFRAMVRRRVIETARAFRLRGCSSA